MEAEVPSVGCEGGVPLFAAADVESSTSERITEAGGEGESSGSSMSSKFGYTNTFYML